MCEADNCYTKFFIGGILICMAGGGIVSPILLSQYLLFGPLLPISIIVLIITPLLLVVLGVIGSISFKDTGFAPYLCISWILIVLLNIGCYVWFAIDTGEIGTINDSSMNTWWNNSTNKNKVLIQEQFYNCSSWNSTITNNCAEYFISNVNQIGLYIVPGVIILTFIFIGYWISNCERVYYDVPYSYVHLI